MGPAFSLASTLGVVVAAAGMLTISALAAITVVLLCVALAFMQLAARFPDAGSSYAWARRAFGEGAGAYTAWILLVANFFAVLASENAGPIEADASTARSKSERTLRRRGYVQVDEPRAQVQARDCVFIIVGADFFGLLAQKGDQRRFHDVGAE